MARRRRRRLGSPPEVHREEASHAFHDAQHHAGLAGLAASRGACGEAFDDLLIAAGALEEGKAHAHSGGGETRWEKGARRAVDGAAKRFKDRCMLRKGK